MNRQPIGQRVVFEYGYAVRADKEQSGPYPIFGSNGPTGYIDSFKVEGPGVIIGRKGSVGKVAYSEKNFTPTDTTYYLKIIDKSSDDLKFWYYFLQILGLEKLNTHSAVPGLSRELAYLLEVNVPSVNAQKKAAAVLSLIDAKIDCNNRMNMELESMAKMLYDYWFVQFDFPNADGKPYKSSGGEMIYNDILKREIPKEWDAINLESLISRSGTGLNPRDNFQLGNGENYYVTIKNVSNGKITLDEKCDRISDDALAIIDRRSQLQAGDILFTSIEPVGITYFIHEKPNNWNINESVFTIRPQFNKITSEYLFFLLSSDQMKSFTKNSSTGSIHKGIRHGVLKSFMSAYGGKVLVDHFSSITKPILQQMNVLENENQHLSQLRNWLLPMLMNGQVSVSQ